MKHYFVYHNVEKMGYSFRDREGLNREESKFSVVTKKKTRFQAGEVVWLVSGEQRGPKDDELGNKVDYRLECRFHIDGMRPRNDEEFPFEVYGSRGHSFPDGILLNDYAWFWGFIDAQQNFRWGMQPIREPIVRQFRAVVREAGGETPEKPSDPAGKRDV